MAAARHFLTRHGRRLVVWLPLAWLVVFFALPLVEVAQTSFTEPRRGIPPFAPLWGFGEDGFFTNFNLENYGLLIEYSQDYLKPAGNSLRLAFFSTLICLLFAYPMAWWIARSSPSQRAILLVLVMLPFWTSSLLRIYALIGLLNTNGFINSMLLQLGLIEANGRQVGPGLLHHPIGQATEVGMPVQLPDTIEVAGPGAARTGVSLISPPQRQQGLQLSRQFQRIQHQLGRGHGGGEQRMNLESHHSIKKAGPWGPARSGLA